MAEIASTLDGCFPINQLTAAGVRYTAAAMPPAKAGTTSLRSHFVSIDIANHARMITAAPTDAERQTIMAPRLNPIAAAESNGVHRLNLRPDATNTATLIRKTEMVSAPTVLSK